MKKQVVLLMTDTTRKDMLGCYGNPRMKTPHLDALAAEGIRYENAYTAQPVCGPARSAIFTGTFPHSNGMVTNSLPLGANVKTLGQRLSDAGVHCAYIGKWHLDGGDYFGLGQCPEGWDPEYWYDMRLYLDELSDADKVRSRQSATAYEEDMSAEFTFAHRCSNRALDFLEKNAGEDFFLTVSYDEPHGPCLCPAPYNRMYDGFRWPDNPTFADTLDNKPLYQRLWAGEGLKLPYEHLNPPSDGLSLFLGCNSFVDAEIGRVLAKIRRLTPDALVIFTSDHGDMLGGHRLQMKNAAAYKEIANVPLLIAGGTMPASEQGQVIHAPASHIDLTPTVMDYMGLPLPKLLEGKSMLPQLEDSRVRINEEVFTEFTRYEVDHDGFGGLQMMRSIISERFKLSVHLLDSDELYDLANDPWEVENRIGDPALAAVRDGLHNKLLEHMNATRDPYRGYQWAVRPWRPDRQPKWENDGYTRQRENEEYEPRQCDYDTGLPMKDAVRKKALYDAKK